MGFPSGSLGTRQKLRFKASVQLALNRIVFMSPRRNFLLKAIERLVFVILSVAKNLCF